MLLKEIPILVFLRSTLLMVLYVLYIVASVADLSSAQLSLCFLSVPDTNREPDQGTAISSLSLSFFTEDPTTLSSPLFFHLFKSKKGRGGEWLVRPTDAFVDKTGSRGAGQVADHMRITNLAVV